MSSEPLKGSICAEGDSFVQVTPYRFRVENVETLRPGIASVRLVILGRTLLFAEGST